MITREQIEEALNDETKKSYVTKNVDYDVIAITLLRERIPYDACKSIINGAGYKKIYLCDVDKCLPYLTESDLDVLADCNCFIDEDAESLALFV